MEEAGLALALGGLPVSAPCVSSIGFPKACTARSSLHDLWPPADDANQDGEVSIRLVLVEEVIQSILTGEFTLDAGTVMVDGLLRLGAVPPEDPYNLTCAASP